VADRYSGYSRRSLLKGLAAGSAALVLGDLPEAGATSGRFPKHRLGRTHPENAGIDPAGILAFIQGVEQKVGGLHSFMLVRGGDVAAEGWWAPYGRDHRHMLFSLSKSFTSTALGLAVHDGKLTVDDPVISFFPEYLPERISPNLKAMKVRHLLSMSTGHEKDATGPTRQAADGNWVKAFLALPVEREPGSLFVYNSAATYICSAIVQKLTGMPVREYLTPRLFKPLGIEGPTWENCPRGINTGGWGLSVRTEDIAKFGQLYLEHGRWDGEQLVPEAWVAAATSKQIANGTNPNSDWNQGYGYQFWRCRHGAYRGDGAFGQYCVVLPEQEAVLAITSGIGDMQAVLNVAWEHLLPAMKAAPVRADHQELKQRISRLGVTPPEGEIVSPTRKRVSGKTVRFEANPEKVESAALTFNGSRCTVTLRGQTGEHRLGCSSREWVRGNLPIPESPSTKVAARGAWTDADTYTMKLCFYETPFVQTVTWKFSGDQVTVTRKMNVGFGPTDRPALTGRIA
jgi:CubicO group peptidase (beta-lactamase class C family)